MKIDIYNTDKKYDIIYADPTWEYKQSGREKNSRGMAKDSAICFLWATFPNIAEALTTMKAWGLHIKQRLLFG